MEISKVREEFEYAIKYLNRMLGRDVSYTIRSNDESKMIPGSVPYYPVFEIEIQLGSFIMIMRVPQIEFDNIPTGLRRTYFMDKVYFEFMSKFIKYAAKKV